MYATQYIPICKISQERTADLMWHVTGVGKRMLTEVQKGRPRGKLVVVRSIIGLSEGAASVAPWRINPSYAGLGKK